MNGAPELSSMQLFSSLDDASLGRVRRLMKRHRIPDGWTIFREGDEGSIMYIVISGTVAVSIGTDEGRELEVARVGEGSFFGEMSILEKDVRSATCRTVGECILLSLDVEGFRSLIEDEPETAILIMYQMLSTTASRLNSTGIFLSDMVKWGENARMRAVTDEFTGLYNRRYFDQALQGVILSSETGGSEPFCLVMLDLDRFGTFNKEYGEAVGDQAIRGVASVIREVFDDTDILARYGGDEFCFILPGKDSRQALFQCSKVASEITKISVLEGKGGSFRHVSASIGIAEYPIHETTAEGLLDKADQALYSAKRAGRNRAMVFTHGCDE